jgi:hypothetical protein
VLQVCTSMGFPGACAMLMFPTLFRLARPAETIGNASGWLQTPCHRHNT